MNDDLKSHLKKRVKEENFQLIDRLLTGLFEAVVVLEEVEEAADVEWAEEMDLIRGKREFDRHSGSDRSGLKHEDKRGGSGSHNWGTVKDELTDLDQSNVTEETPEGEEHPVADTENKENEVEEVKEEGPKEMTLDEWKAIQNKDRAKVEFNIRKPNEGADGQWKKGFVLINQRVKRLMLKIRLWTIISGSQQMI